MGDVVKCAICHKRFKRQDRYQKYCSPTCYAQAIKIKRGKVLMKKECPICHAVFETNRENKIYCSLRCCQIAGKQKQSEQRKATREDKAIKQLNVYLKPVKTEKKHKSNIEIIRTIAKQQKVSAGLVKEYFPDRLHDLYKLAAYKRKARGVEK